MLTKNYGLDNGHIFNVTVGQVTHLQTVILEQQLISSMGANEGQTYYNFIKAVMENSGLNPALNNLLPFKMLGLTCSQHLICYLSARNDDNS